MADLTLDTSGAVESAFTDGTPQVRLYWSNLDAFTQGYVGALFETQRVDPSTGLLGFSDLAPEALAMILADCAARLAVSKPGLTRAIAGKLFWLNRQAGVCGPEWPPLTASLGDGGKVHLEARA